MFFECALAAEPPKQAKRPMVEDLLRETQSLCETIEIDPKLRKSFGKNERSLQGHKLHVAIERVMLRHGLKDHYLYRTILGKATRQMQKAA